MSLELGKLTDIDGGMLRGRNWMPQGVLWGAGSLVPGVRKPWRLIRS